MKESTPRERAIIPAREASQSSKQEVPLNTYHLCLWGTQPLLQCCTCTPTSPFLSPPLRTHLYCEITELMGSVLIQPPKHLFPLLRNRTHMGKSFFSWILARRRKSLLQNTPVYFSNYILKVLLETGHWLWFTDEQTLHSIISSYWKNSY